jgi:N-acetylglucosamine kinase-like BadF-type ATPase
MIFWKWLKFYRYNMIAVVYSGSKTAFWQIAKDGQTIAECTMPGINPCLNDEKMILQGLNRNTTLINNAERIKKIYVFAAGATSPSRIKELEDTLTLFFKNSKVVVKDDLYGAALAACYNNSGIVSVLGSGSNCAYFDGKHAEHNNFGLGFLLGDEGSSNYLGKKLLKAFMQGKLPTDLNRDFELKYNLDRPLILEKIYKKSMPQLFLSNFFDFFVEWRNHPCILEIIDEAFETYFNTYLLPTMKLHPGKDIHFVGTVAGSFQNRLQVAAEKFDIKITSVTTEPIYNLLKYYLN